MFNTFSRPLLDPRLYRMDDILKRPYTAATPMGCAGAFVWADASQGWGFCSGVHLGARVSPEGIAPFTISLSVEGEVVEPGDALYRPSCVTLNGRHEDSGLQVTEDKFITDDDVIVSVLSLRNPSETAISVEIDYAWGIASGASGIVGNSFWIRREAPPGDDLIQRLPAGARRTMVFAVAVAPTRDEAFYRSSYWRERENPTFAQAAAYQNWFDENVPRFDCSDLWLTKLWYHRQVAVRRLRGETAEAEAAMQKMRADPEPNLFQAMTEYAKAQFENGDYSLPRETDADVAFRYVGASQPALCRLIEEQLLGLTASHEGELTIVPNIPLPSEGGWSHFCWENLPCQGRLLAIASDDPHDPSFDAYQDGDMGLTVYADGRRLYHQEDLQPFTVALPL